MRLAWLDAEWEIEHFPKPSPCMIWKLAIQNFPKFKSVETDRWAQKMICRCAWGEVCFLVFRMLCRTFYQTIVFSNSELGNWEFLKVQISWNGFGCYRSCFKIDMEPGFIHDVVTPKESLNHALSLPEEFLGNGAFLDIQKWLKWVGVYLRGFRMRSWSEIFVWW